nr:NAD(P)-binding domain-containing protein [Streptacidiphilus albus]
MRIGILGTGTMASALAEAWTRAGHRVLVGGRSLDKAQAVAERLGDLVAAAVPAEVVRASDAVLVAVAWEGIDQVLALAGAAEGSFAGKAVIDCTNAVDYASGMLKPAVGSAAEHVAERAVGGHVVKALHLFAGTGWLSPAPAGQPERTVAICGDDAGALDTTAELIRDLGAVPAVIGGLEHARQLEDVAGFVMRLVAAGCNPVTAVPFVDLSHG